MDGGVEREVSQMRQLVLQTALSLGFKGIEDLEKKTEPKNSKNKAIKIKSYIEKAAGKHKGLHLAIPATFTNLGIGRIRQYAKRKNVQQIFSRIIGGKTAAENARFKRTVERLGNERAWFRGVFNAIAFKINNLRIGCESKKYVLKHFESGVRCSALARNMYKLCQAIYGKKILDFTVSNDLIFVRNVNKKGTWESCDPKYKGDDPVVKISARGFEAWLKLKEKPDLEDWWEKHKNDDIYSEAIVDQQLKSATSSDELADHPFYLKHQRASGEEVKKMALMLLAHLSMAYANDKPDNLRKLAAAIERILERNKKSSNNLLLLCDELFQQMEKQPDIDPAIIKSLHNKCGLTLALEEALESKEKNVKSGSSATQRIQAKLEENELEKNLAEKLEVLHNRFGITIIQKEECEKLGIKDEVFSGNIKNVLKVEKGDAAGTIIAETPNDKNYMIYSLKNSEDAGIYEQAYIMLKLFISNRGANAPIYLLTPQPKLLEALMVIGKANELDLRDSDGNTISVNSEVSEKIKNTQVNHPNYLDLNPKLTEKNKIDRSVLEWGKRADEIPQLESLNTLEKLANAKAQLTGNIMTGEGLKNNSALSTTDKELIVEKLTAIRQNLLKVEEKMNEMKMDNEPTPALGAQSIVRRFFGK